LHAACAFGFDDDKLSKWSQCKAPQVSAKHLFELCIANHVPNKYLHVKDKPIKLLSVAKIGKKKKKEAKWNSTCKASKFINSNRTSPCEAPESDGYQSAYPSTLEF
jgi:hypothetical protein